MSEQLHHNSESEELQRLRLALQGSNDGHWDWNVETGGVYYFQRFRELLGYHSETEFPNLFSSFESHLHPADLEPTLAAVQAHIDDRMPYDVMYRLRTASGEYRWFRARGNALRNERGDAVRMAGSITDITDLKSIEQQMHAANAQRQAILDAANFTIISTGVDGVIQTFNLGAENMLGYSSKEVVGKVTPAVIHDVDEVVKRAKTLSAEMGQTIEPGFEVFVAKARLGIPDEKEWTYVRKDGSSFPVLLSVTALHDEQGNLSGFLGVGRDISDWKKLDRIKREFVSVVSHELRTPLTAIQGVLGLIHGGAAGAIPEKLDNLLEIASRNSDRLMTLINDILDIERIQTGKLQFNLQPLQAAPVVQRMLEINDALAKQKNIRLLSESLDASLLIHVDVDRLEQVIANLLSNAIKFSPPGSCVRISVMESGPFIRIRVSDEGPGIPEPFHDRVFDRFVQVDSSDQRGELGAGLGLTITKALVERMHGNISLDSCEGGGATFNIDFPRYAKLPEDAN